MGSIVVLRHVPDETLGVIAGALDEARLAWRYVDLFETVPESLDLEDSPGLIILGGPMNADEVEKYPFLAPEVDWIRQAVGRELPVLGICLGSQLLAKALGATVRPNGRKEIGWYSIELTEVAEHDSLFAGCAAKQTVYQFHGDTFTLPRGAVHLAQSPWCKNQAFRFGRHAYGLQFHIEVTRQMAEDWLAQPDNQRMIAELDYVDPDQIRRQTPAAITAMHALGRRILPRFAAMCLEHRRRVDCQR
ncbi:MAG: type 1 glutamine amidotransferase [Pirellulales bacterium]|nr:type 1 glutamine amidotransferase [Pirellulales bacterium]